MQTRPAVATQCDAAALVERRRVEKRNTPNPDTPAEEKAKFQHLVKDGKHVVRKDVWIWYPGKTGNLTVGSPTPPRRTASRSARNWDSATWSATISTNRSC